MKLFNKLFITFVIVGLMTNILFASERSIQELENIALNLANEKKPDTIFSIKKEDNKQSNNKQYVKIQLEPKGWVIVSKYDTYEPVIGYNLDVKVNNSTTSPEFEHFMQGINEAIHASKKDNRKRSEKISVEKDNIAKEWKRLSVNPETFKEELPYSKIIRSTSNINTEKYLDMHSKGATWNQKVPYNNLTPVAGTSHTLVGCVATAFSQIMAYHKWPKRGWGTHSYTHEKYGVPSANFDTEYNWNNITDELKAKVSYHVGVSVDMDYDTNSSDAHAHSDRWRKFFHYDMDDIVPLAKFTKEQWATKVKESIDKNLPVYCSSSTPFERQVEHAYVLEGYQFSSTSKKFYMNWGWSGQNNGWFTIKSLPRYQNSKAIFNIKPNRSGINMPTELEISDAIETSATLKWKDNSENESGFKIYRDKKPIRIVGSDVTTFEDHTLKGLDRYTYSIKAYGSKGESAAVSKTFNPLSTDMSQAEAKIAPSKYFKQAWFTFPRATYYPPFSIITKSTFQIKWKRNDATRVFLSADVSEKESGGDYKILFKKKEVHGSSYTIRNLSKKVKILSLILTSQRNGKHLGPLYASAVVEIGGEKPKAPTNFKAIKITKTSAILTWKDNSDNEYGFKIHNSRTGRILERLSKNVTSYKLTNLSPDGCYRFRITAHNRSGNTPFKYTKFFTRTNKSIKKTIITSPKNSTKIKLGKKVRVTWKNHGSTKNDIYIKAYSNGVWRIVKERHYTRFSGYFGSSVWFKMPKGVTKVSVQIKSYFNYELLGDSVIYLYPKTPPNNIPEAPSNLKAINVQKTTATLRWIDKSNNEQGFKIYKGSRYEGRVAKNVRSYPLKNLQAGKTYTYSVKAYNKTGESNKSSTNFKTKPNIPKGSKSIITSPVNNTQVKAGENITIRWKNHGASSLAMDVRTNVNGNYKYIFRGSVHGTSKTFKIPKGAKGKVYIILGSYSKKLLGYSRISLKVNTPIQSKSIISSPKNRTKVKAVEYITIRWQNHGATRIEFYASAKVNGIYKKIKRDTNIKGSSTRIKIPLGFTQAYIYIKSYRANNKSLGSSKIYLYPKTPPKPKAPSNLKAKNVQKTTATLTWKDNSTNEQGFKIYNGSTLVKTLGANRTSYRFRNLKAGKTYTYSVKAYNKAGYSPAVSITFHTFLSSIPTIAFNTKVNNGWMPIIPSTHRKGRYARYYTFTLKKPTKVVIDLISSQDTYLYLLKGKGKKGTVVTRDNDGGKGRNSRITRTLAVGSYTIEATTFKSKKTGAFSVKVSK